MTDEEESAFFKSDEFKEAIKRAIEADTWDKGFPKIYLDDDDWIVEHWKDGTIVKLKKLETRTYG